MKLYITFGQAHAHRVNGNTFDCNSVAAINCQDEREGRSLAYEYFDKGKFAFSYTKCPDLKYFRRGVIEVNPDYIISNTKPEESQTPQPNEKNA